MFVKLIIFTPLTHAAKIRETLGKNQCGSLGNYDYCSFSSIGTGRFRPNDKAKPYLGETGVLEEVTEEKIEVICEEKHLKKILKEVKKAHPYEEPAIDIYPLLNHKYL